MPNFTPNFNLEKPLQEEFYNVDVQNANMDKIDTELKKLGGDADTYVKKAGDTMSGNLLVDGGTEWKSVGVQRKAAGATFTTAFGVASTGSGAIEVSKTAADDTVTREARVDFGPYGIQFDLVNRYGCQCDWNNFVNGTILDWANACKVNTTKMVIGSYAPPDLPTASEGHVAVIVGSNDRKTVLFYPYKNGDGVYMRDVFNRAWLNQWRPITGTIIAATASLDSGVMALDVGNDVELETGTEVRFTAPCTCADVTGGVTIGGQTYQVVDAMCNCVTGKGGRWQTGAEISLVLDCDGGKAYLQNGATPDPTASNTQFDDTNTALGAGNVQEAIEAHVLDKTNPHEVTAQQSAIQETTKNLLEASFPNTESGLLALYMKVKGILDKFDSVTNSYSWLEYQKQENNGATETKRLLSMRNIDGSLKWGVSLAYSNDISINGSKVTLNNPTWIEGVRQGNTFAIVGTSEIPVGSYVVVNVEYLNVPGRPSTTNLSSVYKWTSTSSVYVTSYNTGGSYADFVVELKNVKNTTFKMACLGIVTSTDPNAYPDKEWVGDKYYEKLPTSVAKIPNFQTGSYVGNGAGNFSLVLSFTAKAIFVMKNGDKTTLTAWVGQQNAGYTPNGTTLTIENTTINANGTTYCYVAFG